jgi:subtilisin family serine protease
MTIAVLDGGFQNVNLLPSFKNTAIAGTRDFVTVYEPTTPEKGPVYQGIDHGTKVLSAMAAQSPEVMMGTAPEARYWLLRCEDPNSETPIEEDYWAMAAEFADSVGCDIINSSLGYCEYDTPYRNYRLRDLDGHSSFISHTASMLARKGIVLCNSAGNSGIGPWKKIGVPADADHIISMGAVNDLSPYHIAPFSSVGPSQDGRVKPDVVAFGAPSRVVSGRGTITSGMGTSFASPIVCGLVACLWQGMPEKTAEEIIELVRQSGNNREHPDNIYGYGMPNFWRAYMVGKMRNEK